MIKRAKLVGMCLALVFLLPVTAGFGAQAQDNAQKDAPKVLILPFQINAGPEQENLNDDLPGMLEQRLISRGVAVISEQAARAQMRRDRVDSLNIESARALAAKMGATAAVYGSYSQVGNAFSIDARYVEVERERLVRPLFVERNELVELLSAVDELATRINNEARRREMIAGVEVRGTKILDPDVVLMRVNTRKGDALDITTINTEMKRVWDLGYFSDISVAVEPRNDGLYLIYNVQEKPRIEAITVEGNDDIDTDDILAAMSTRIGAVLNEKLLAEDLSKIREVFRKEGYYLGTVTHHVDMRESGSGAILVLHVSEGNKLYIKEIKLDGTEQLKASKVKGEMLLAERGWFSWLTGSGVLREEMLDRDASAIVQYYLNNGFMDIVVGASKVDYEEDGIVVTFPIKEGTRYRLGEISFAGELIDTDEILRQQIRIDEAARRNEYFNLSAMQDDAKKLTEFYAEYGYAFADVLPAPQKRADEPGIVDIAYHIEKKQKVYIRRAVIEGNIRTRDNVILRELRLTDGDLFIGSRLQRSINRLNRLDYFDVAEAELIPTNKDEEVDLQIKVKEKSTGSIMGGFGYSTYSQFGVSGTIMEKNLFGKGHNLSVNATFSGRYTAYTMAFRNPRVNDTSLGFGIDLYNTEYDFYDYEKRTTGGIVRLYHPIGEYTSVMGGYRLDRYELSDFNDNAAQVIRQYTGQRWSSVLLGQVTRNTTDSYRATKGTVNTLSLEYGGGFIGGDDDFISASVEHRAFHQLFENHVLHFRTKGSAVFTNGSGDIPVFERFWMGGVDSVRGYRSRDIVPRDPATGDRIGGTRMAFANFEYIWEMAPQIGVSLVPFFDIGFNLDDKADYKWSDELLRSFGMELRWRSPMGDLRFAYGIPMDEDRNGDRGSGRFEFSMGQSF